MNPWDFLVKKFDEGRLGHAYILAGADHQAKKDFVRKFVAYISKNVPGSAAAIEKSQFPDLLVVSSAQSDSSVKNEKDMLEIDIDQVRQVQQFLSYKSYYGGVKVVVIEHAERMSPQAQHCFLKTLEEPKGQTLILLLSTKPDLLLQTIASRCQVVRFSGALAEHSLPKGLLQVLGADLAEKFKFVKGVDVDGENFETMLIALQNHWRKDIGKYQQVLKLALDLEYQAKVSNVNKKLALEMLLLET